MKVPLRDRFTRTERVGGIRTTCAAALLVFATAWPAAAQHVVTLPARDRALEVNARTLFTVGRDDGVGPDVFGNIVAVAFDAVGNLYVLDGLNARVVVFDTAGRYLRQFGRRGRGPGEFSRPSALAITRGAVVVREGSRGYHVFGVDGGFRHFLRHSITPTPAGPLHAYGDAVLTGGIGIVFENNTPRGLDHAPLMLQPLTAGAATTTLFRLRTPTTQISGSLGAGAAGITIDPGVRAGETAPLWAATPDGRLALVHGGTYEVRLARGGSVFAVVRRDIAPRALTARDRDAVRQQERSALVEGGVQRIGPGGATEAAALPRHEVEKRLNALRFAERVSPVAALAADAAGRLWIARAGNPLTELGPIDVLDAELRYVGTMRPQPLPDAFGPGERAAFIRRDEYGVERIVVRRLTGF